MKKISTQNGSELGKLFAGQLGFQTLCLWFAFFLVMFGFYFVMSWTPKILISMGMSPEQGVSTGILISIGGIFGAAIIGLLASRMKIFYALSLFFRTNLGMCFPICRCLISSQHCTHGGVITWHTH